MAASRRSMETPLPREQPMAGRQSFAVTIYGVSAADQHVHGWDAPTDLQRSLFLQTGHGPQRPDCLADDAVSCELVSAPNSLLTGKLTGNFANSGPQQRFPHLINELIQRLAAKFPTQRNREFSQP